jgi:hypothetical protein
MAQPVESAQPVKVKPTLAAERAPAHHPQNDQSQFAIHFASRPFALLAVPAEVGQKM